MTNDEETFLPPTSPNRPWMLAIWSVLAALGIGALAYAAFGVWLYFHLGYPGSVRVADSYATPAETVRAYYLAISRGDRGALQLIGQGSRPLHANSLDSDINNVKALNNLKVGEAQPYGDFQGWRDTVEVAVSYDADYREVITTRDGPQARLVILGREGGSGPWRIISIGTGP